MGDAPPRLAEALASADIVYAEDTRRTGKLLEHLGVDKPIRSYFVGNEDARSGELADRLHRGEVVALITDAGTPGISDPGLTAVVAARGVGASVTGVPGPSAVTLALAVSGLPADRFVFEGFLPRKPKRRSRRIEDLAGEERTAVLFSAPSRLAADLADLEAACGADRPLVVCRELTKLHEEVWVGTLGEAAADWADRKVKGEVTVVLGGGELRGADVPAAVAMARRLTEEGMPAGGASRAVAKSTGVSRRKIYESLIDRHPDGAGDES